MIYGIDQWYWSMVLIYGIDSAKVDPKAVVQLKYAKILSLDEVAWALHYSQVVIQFQRFWASILLILFL